MSHIVHARRVNHAIRYRVWSTVADAYFTPEMTEAEAREWLLEEAREQARRLIERANVEITERLQRAIIRGNSAYGSRIVDIDQPWETERCEKCSCFHHAFIRRDDGRCRECGETEDDLSHKPACR